MTRAARAFTLIEALAVIAIMALLTGAAAVSLTGAARAARVEDVAERVAAFDRATREAARRFARTPALRFELNRGSVARVDGDARGAATLALGGGVRVTRVVLGGRSVASGEVSVPFSTRGQAPSYAVLLAGPAGERWVAFAGLTGQAVVVRDERDALDILSATTPPDGTGGADAR